MGEIWRGIERRRLKDARAAAALERWLAGLITHYGDRILPITASIAGRWGRMCLQRPLPVTDGLMAATALDHDLVLVTRNIEDFQRSGAVLENPFS